MMKISTRILTIAAMLSVPAMLSVSSIALAAPAANPAANPATGDHVTALKGTPSQKEELRAKTAEAEQLSHDAAVDLHAGNYAQAEDEARQSLSLVPEDGVPAEVLAAALNAQGKDQAALQAYRTVVEHYDKQPRNLLPYAGLLLKSGQWAQAVAVYNQALPRLGHEELEQITSHFSPDDPQPEALAAAIHLECGQLYNAATDWAGEPQNTEAMAEYAKALQLAPENALANYYYGVGWHKLSAAERVKFGHADQAKAALTKAAQTGDANVKKMAEEALKKSN